MNQVTITEVRQKGVAWLKDQKPCEITSDGEVIGVFQDEYNPGEAMTQCPNCKMKYKYTKPSNAPPFLSGKVVLSEE